MHAFTLIFLLAVAGHLMLQLWLARRQIMFVRRHRDAVPDAFEAVISATEHAKAADYSVARQRLGAIESVYDTGIVLLLTLGGGIAALGTWASRAFDTPLWSGTAHVLLVFAVLATLGLPFSIYRTFVLEERFGFNRTRPGVFLADHLKGWLLGLVLGGAATAGVLWIMASAGRWWWIVAWLAWLFFSLLVTWAWPRLIAPIFNKFSPLEDAALRQRINARRGFIRPAARRRRIRRRIVGAG